MNGEAIEDVLRNVDVRLTRVEQYLPRLATCEELQAAIAPLATREEALSARVDALARP